MSAKQKILRGLARLDTTPGNLDFRSVLSALAETELSKSTIDAQAFVQANVKKYWNWFSEELDDQLRRGIQPYYTLVGGSTYAFFHTACSMLELGDAQKKVIGQLATSRPNILRQIDDLTDRQYEAMACVACEVIGARFQVLTPPGNEGGIDFLATLTVKDCCHVFSTMGAELRIVGQCKKHKSPIAVDRVEQFLQTMNNVRHRSERLRRHLPAWFDDARGPIIGWVIAHSGYQTGAADEAKKHGIVLSDSMDMADLFSFANAFHGSEAPLMRAKHLFNRCQALL